VEKKRNVFGGVGCLPVSGEVLEDPTADWLPPFLLLALREEDLREEALVYEMIALGFAASRMETILRALSEMEAEGMVAAEPDATPFGKRCWCSTRARVPGPSPSSPAGRAGRPPST